MWPRPHPALTSCCPISRPPNLLTSPSAASTRTAPSPPDSSTPRDRLLQGAAGCGTRVEAVEKVHVASVRNHALTRLLGGWQLREQKGGEGGERLSHKPSAKVGLKVKKKRGGFVIKWQLHKTLFIKLFWIFNHALLNFIFKTITNYFSWKTKKQSFLHAHRTKSDPHILPPPQAWVCSHQQDRS